MREDTRNTPYSDFVASVLPTLECLFDVNDIVPVQSSEQKKSAKQLPVSFFFTKKRYSHPV